MRELREFRETNVPERVKMNKDLWQVFVLAVKQNIKEWIYINHAETIGIDLLGYFGDDIYDIMILCFSEYLDKYKDIIDEEGIIDDVYSSACDSFFEICTNHTNKKAEELLSNNIVDVDYKTAITVAEAIYYEIIDFVE